MVGLAAPWWLLALAALPLLRWLHRFNAPLYRVPVSAVFLWQPRAVPDSAGRRRSPPDPAWRRRAFIAVVLVIVLSQPWWRVSQQPLTVWIDNSPSMHSVENGQSRLATALNTHFGPRTNVETFAETDSRTTTVRSLIKQFGTVTLRSLGDPADTRLASEPGALDAARWLAAEPRAPATPPIGLMAPTDRHWLVTDGAHADVVRWAESAPLAGIISVGRATENVAITRLASRRSADSDGRFDLLIETVNRGLQPATRDLQLTSGSAILESRTLTLAAGETRRIEVQHSLGAAPLTAALSAGDALALDDVLVLEAAEFSRLPVLVDSRCPRALRLAVAAHPALAEVAANASAALQFECSGGSAGAPALLRMQSGSTMPIDSQPQWLPAAGKLQGIRLSRTWLAAAAWDPSQLQDAEPLLVAGDQPLIVRRFGTPLQIETVLDLGQPGFARQPEYAALIAGLADLALQRPLLDAVSIASRSPADATIAPTRPAIRAFSPARWKASQQSLSGPLLALAAVLLLLDLARVLQAQRSA